MRPSQSHKLILVLVLCALAPAARGQGVQGAGLQALLEAPPDRPGPLSQGEIRLSTSLDKQIIRIGDLVQYQLSVSAPAGSIAIMPQAGAELGGFIIRDYKIIDRAEEEKPGAFARAMDWIEQRAGIKRPEPPLQRTFHYTITSYDVGDLAIPPLPMIVQDPEGKAHALFAPSARVRVAAVTSPDDLTIRDIAAPVAAPFSYKRVLPYALLPLLAVIAATAAAILVSKRRRPAEAISGPPLPAHEIALAELLALEREELLKAGEFERFYVRLSHILRKYLALRYSIYALEYTTSEILERLKRLDLGLADFETTRGFLNESDLVKFARHTPALEERSSAIGRVRGVIERTHLEPPPEAGS